MLRERWHGYAKLEKYYYRVSFTCHLPDYVRQPSHVPKGYLRLTFRQIFDNIAKFDSFNFPQACAFIDCVHAADQTAYRSICYTRGKYQSSPELCDIGWFITQHV